MEHRAPLSLPLMDYKLDSTLRNLPPWEPHSMITWATSFTNQGWFWALPRSNDRLAGGGTHYPRDHSVKSELRYTFVKHSFSNFNVHTNDLGILLKEILGPHAQKLWSRYIGGGEQRWRLGRGPRFIWSLEFSWIVIKPFWTYRNSTWDVTKYIWISTRRKTTTFAR